jgi:integrase
MRGQERTVKPDNKPDNRSSPLTKHSKAYWLAKVYRPKVRGGEVDNYAVRLHHGGIQRNFSLATPNRDLAAAHARDWFVYLSANGWMAFLAKYREPVKPGSDSSNSALRTHLTIGEYLTAVRTESDLAHKTLADYEGCLRFIVAGIMEMGKSCRQYDHYRGGHKAWRAAIDAVPLESITPDKVRVWKKEYVNRAGRDELARRRRIVNVNSYLRRARALFAKKVRLKSVALAVSPFDGVALERRTDTKFYGAGVDPFALLQAAVNELAEDRIEELKAFLLGLTLGLRRREIDLLEWQSFDFVAGTLRIMPTKWYQLKTNESAGELPVEPEILELFRGWRARATSEFVLESDRPPRALDYEYYRCEPTFKALVEWLRSKGVQGNKPLHALRKLYGSALADLHGLHAASSGLRHADIRTTSAFYADRRVKVAPGFGSAISGASVTHFSLEGGPAR